MLLWVILALCWLVILFVAVSLFRIAGYADKKMRRFVHRPRHSEDQAA